jgi:predicted CoA-binding protein
MNSLKAIDNFLLQKNIAIAGVSRNRNKFGSTIYRELKKKNYNVYPVNPNIKTYDSHQCYADVISLPAEVNALVINTSPVHTMGIINEAEFRGIPAIWVQQGAENNEVIRYAEANSRIICKECLLMHLHPLSFPHNLHKALRKIFGKFPK